MKKQWQEFARDMEELEAEMEAMAKTMPSEHVSCSRTSFTRNGKTMSRQNSVLHGNTKSSSSIPKEEREHLLELMEMRMERLIQQRTNMLYVLVGISLLLSLLALIAACIV